MRGKRARANKSVLFDPGQKLLRQLRELCQTHNLRIDWISTRFALVKVDRPVAYFHRPKQKTELHSRSRQEFRWKRPTPYEVEDAIQRYIQRDEKDKEAEYFDDQRRIHSLTGPAIIYQDGFAVYAVRGVYVTPDWFGEKSLLDAQSALGEENIERRRVAFEILGWAKILTELNAKIIDTDPDPMIGKLVEVNHPALGGRARFIWVLCGTGREFAVGVGLHHKTALEANAASYHIPPDLLRTMKVRT